MASQLSSIDLISDRYATALYDFAIEANKVDSIIGNFELLTKYVQENKNLKLLIKSPLISSYDKFKVLERILSKESIDNLTITFLKVITNNKRINYLSSIISKFIKINAKKRGDVLVDVTSSDHLVEEQKNDIKNQLKLIFGNKIFLHYQVDKKIIGGLIVKVGSKMIDSSLASKIDKLEIAMKEV